MSLYLRKGLFGLLLLISIIGFVSGAEPSGYTVYVQGEQSSIARTAEGMYEITIQDIIPFSSIIDGDTYILAPTKHLANETKSLNAVIILSGSEIDVTFLVEVSNLTYDSEPSTMTFKARPMEFYNGELLKPFLSGQGDLDAATGKSTNLTALYLEIINPVAENKWNPQFPCCVEGPGGQCYMKC